jgi:hypothetical protein
MPRVIVFDLMGTLLDLRAMDPHFERFFGDAAVRKEWWAQTFGPQPDVRGADLAGVVEKILAVEFAKD